MKFHTEYFLKAPKIFPDSSVVFLPDYRCEPDSESASVMTHLKNVAEVDDPVEFRPSKFLIVVKENVLLILAVFTSLTCADI